MKMALVWLAHARARRVFPVPGGPCNKTPGETGGGQSTARTNGGKRWDVLTRVVLMVMNKQRFRIQKNFKTLHLKPRLATKTRTLGRNDAEIDEHVGSRHWQNDSLEQLLDLFVTAPDVTEFFLWFLVKLHRHYTRVISNVMWARAYAHIRMCV